MFIVYTNKSQIADTKYRIYLHDDSIIYLFIIIMVMNAFVKDIQVKQTYNHFYVFNIVFTSWSLFTLITSFTFISY